jgi:hypothetical protein
MPQHHQQYQQLLPHRPRHGTVGCTRKSEVLSRCHIYLQRKGVEMRRSKLLGSSDQEHMDRYISRRNAQRLLNEYYVDH